MGSARKPLRRKVALRPKKIAKPTPTASALKVSSKELVLAVRRGVFKAMRSHIAQGVPMVYSEGNVIKRHSIREMRAMLKKAEAAGLA